MSPDGNSNTSRSLREIELEVLRRRARMDAPTLGTTAAGTSRPPGRSFSPLSARKAQHRRKQPMGLRTVVGRVKLKVWQGQDPQDKHWGCPIREQWGLRAHQQMSPALEEKLAFTATLVGSYEATSLVAAHWGCPVNDSVVHALVQRAGAKAVASEAATAPATGPAKGATTCGFAIGGADARWLVGAFSRAWVGNKENQQRARSMARNKEWSLLPARAVRTNRRRPRAHL